MPRDWKWLKLENVSSADLQAGSSADATDADESSAAANDAPAVSSAAPATHDEDPDLAELKQVWRRKVRPQFEPAIDTDPLFQRDDILVRFLNAERGGGGVVTSGASGGGARMRKRDAQLVAKTAARLESTASFRREYACVDFHRKGMARQLLMHHSNAGACVYFGEYGLQSRGGVPIMVGRGASSPPSCH